MSVAAVYKRLDKTLKPYVKEIDGKKYLAAEILEIEGIQPVETGIKPGLNTQYKPGEAQEVSQGKSQDTTPPAFLELLEALQGQLSEKDKQIARLQDEAAELRQASADKDKFIQEQAGRLAYLLEQSQELQRNNQVLLRLAQGEAPAQPAGDGLEAQEAPEPAETQPASQDTAGSNAGEQKPVLPWWKRLFRGK